MAKLAGLVAGRHTCNPSLILHPETGFHHQRLKTGGSSPARADRAVFDPEEGAWADGLQTVHVEKESSLAVAVAV